MKRPADLTPRPRCFPHKAIPALIWLLLLGAAMFARTCHLLRDHLRDALAVSPLAGYGLFLLLGSVRGFTLVPSTYLVALGLLLFPPWPLFWSAMAGIVASSLSVYYFAEYMQLAALLEERYGTQADRVRRSLSSNQLPLIVCWSAAPLLPTDLICYLAGTMRIDVKRLILGVTIGESLTVASYVFLGHQLVEHGADLLQRFL